MGITYLVCEISRVIRVIWIWMCLFAQLNLIFISYSEVRLCLAVFLSNFFFFFLFNFSFGVGIVGSKCIWVWI